MNFLRYCFRYKEVIEALGIMARGGYSLSGCHSVSKGLLERLGHDEEIWEGYPRGKSPPDYLNVP